jgi:hypothetical protein
MKNLFRIDESERARILALHESATRKQYLSEETPSPTRPPIDPKQLPDKWGGVSGPLGANQWWSTDDEKKAIQSLLAFLEAPVKDVVEYYSMYISDNKGKFTDEELDNFENSDTLFMKINNKVSNKSGNEITNEIVSKFSKGLNKKDIREKVYNFLKTKNLSTLINLSPEEIDDVLRRMK